MERVPSAKLVYTIWLSHENAAWEIGAVKSPGIHWKIETQDIFIYIHNRQPITAKNSCTHTHTQRKPAVDILDSWHHRLKDESHARQGSEFDSH